MAADTTLCTDASHALAAAAKTEGIAHEALNTARGERRRGPWHIQNVNAYPSRWKTWMVRFHRVATSNTTWARSAPATATPSVARRPRRCLRSPSGHEGILR
jgi:hypothetical protein